MPALYSKEFGKARSKIIYSPKILDGSILRNMSKGGSPLDNAEVTRRLILLRKAISGDSQTAFAKRIGIEVRRWNNFERGLPLSKDVGIILCEKIQGVTLDYLHRGKLDAVPLALREALDAAGKANTAPGSTKRRD
jgi:hypothetical protein